MTGQMLDAGAVPTAPLRKTRTVVPLVVASALLMQNLNSTVLTTAIPAIARDLQVDPVHLKLALTAYLMSLAVFVPASGWLADRFGPRSVLVAAIGVFTSASLLCALSQSLTELVAARVLQGIGGAMMLPVARLVVVRSTDKHELVNALSWIMVPALIGPIVGPPLGGLAVTYATWHWIFLINIPIGLVGMILCWRVLPSLAPVKRSFDLWGFVLSGAGLSLVVVASSLLGVGGDVEAALAAAAAATVLLSLFVRHARVAPQPILDLSLLRIATVRTSILGGSCFRIGVGATPFLLPLLLQIGFHLTPLASGLVTFAAGAGALFMKLTAARILGAFGYRRVLVVNGAVSAVLMAAPILFSPASPFWIMIMVLFLAGFLRSLELTAINALAYDELGEDQIAAATTLGAVAQQIAVSLGVSFAAVSLQLTRAAPPASAGGAAPSAPLTIVDFEVAFAAIAVVALLSVLSFRTLPPGSGDQLVEQPPAELLDPHH